MCGHNFSTELTLKIEKYYDPSLPELDVLSALVEEYEQEHYSAKQ